ncbi:MAG TPA: hypothetical protein VGS07_10765 [Thermoanaerobaculia bacterium]|jgi:hypothetical protein|nr:hypothetical protein [Thermoanaerobaculia bacterium]
MPKATFPEETTDWGQLATTVDVNKADLAYLEPHSSRLTVVLDGARSTKLRQEAFKAQVQQSTRDLEAFMKEGRDLATRLRNGIRTQYGLKGEKLTEFGLKPRRKPQKKATPGPVAQPTPVTVTPVDTK